MKRALLGFMMAAGLVLAAMPADARIRLQVTEVQWLAWNRGAALNSGAGTPSNSTPLTYVTLDSTKSDTTVTISVKDLAIIPPPIAPTSDAGDTNRVIARLFVVCDSTTAPTFVGSTFKVMANEGTRARLLSGTTRVTEVNATSILLVSRTFSGGVVGQRCYSFPIVDPLSPSPISSTQDPTTLGGPLLFPGLQFAFSSSHGKIGRARAYLVYYTDAP